MTINLTVLTLFYYWIKKIPLFKVVVVLSVLLSVGSILFFLNQGQIIAYGDAESHLNIAKRVVSSITPGLAQLGGIWPPLPHLLMVPFVYFDPLWRSGLAGAVISGTCFVIASIFLYKFTFLLTKNAAASFVAFLVFALNPNILYMQSTPMTELPLLAFFILSIYYFTRYIKNDKEYLSLIFAAFFAFCASLSRYDGWFLVGIEGFILLLMNIRTIKNWQKVLGKIVLFATLAFFGILLWLIWDYLILGDPLYFTNSQFSAKSQQQSWLARGELPGYQSLTNSFIYYVVTSLSNTGVILFLTSVIGIVIFLIKDTVKQKWLITLLLSTPFIFYVITQYVGQSVIFIPHITPSTFEWRLFNVRYGLMMVPTVAFFIGYLFYISTMKAKGVVIGLFFFQIMLYGIGYSGIITLADGTVGLSAAKKVDAQNWLAKNYDYGLVLLDDFARTVSITKAGIPMQKVIYIGNKPYWEESLEMPEKHARWIIIQKDDAVWNSLYADEGKRGRVFRYFEKAYTSPEILIFRRNQST